MSQKFVCATCCSSGKRPAGHRPHHRLSRIKSSDTTLRRRPPCAAASSQTYSVDRIPRATGSRCVENITSPRIQPQMLDYFRGVPVREQTIRTKIFVHLDEVHFALGLLARARRARTCNRKRSRARARSTRPRSAAAIPESPTSDSIRDWPPGAPQAARRRKSQAIRKPPCASIPRRPAPAIGTTARTFPRHGSGTRRSNPPRACPPPASLRNQFERRLVRRRQKRHARPARRHRFHREWPAGRLTPAAQVAGKYRSGNSPAPSATLAQIKCRFG